MKGITSTERLFLVFRIFIIVSYAFLVVGPWIFLLKTGLPQAFSNANPEVINGLLTGSSILFGFAMLPIGKRKPDTLLKLMMLGDLGLLAECGFTIFGFGLQQHNGLISLLFTTASLNANAVTAFYRLVISG
jgi:hypothetical protein